MNVIIIGAGIMGTTFATLAKEMAPELDITILERLDGPGAGNSWVFNNAGTGHEANCELNYTPVDEEVISVEKAVKIHAQFNVAKQFWAYLIQKGAIKDPKSFINQTLAACFRSIIWIFIIRSITKRSVGTWNSKKYF